MLGMQGLSQGLSGVMHCGCRGIQPMPDTSAFLIEGEKPQPYDLFLCVLYVWKRCEQDLACAGVPGNSSRQCVPRVRRRIQTTVTQHKLCPRGFILIIHYPGRVDVCSFKVRNKQGETK